MVELRTAPLEGHIEYTLDCAVEAYELDACSHFVLRLYGRNEDLVPIIGPARQPPSEADMLLRIQEIKPGLIQATKSPVLRDRLAMCGRLTDIADHVLAELPPEEAGGLAYQGLIEIPRRIADLAEIYAQWAVTDETVGGDMKPFRDRERVDRNDDPPPRLQRRLASPRFARGYIRENHSSYDLRAVVGRSLMRARRIPSQYVRSTYGAIWKALRQQIEAERSRQYQRMLAPPPLKPDQKRMLRRAAATAANVVGDQAVAQFVRGEDVELPGDQVSLVIARRGSLAAIGHGTIAVAVKDRDGEHLGQLCVYFKGTPALDQLTALALHMQAGLEAEVLKTANVTSATERGLAHPLFKSRKAVVADISGLVFTDPRRSYGLSRWERDKERSARYWAKTGSMWTDRLSTFVLGRNRPWLDAAIAAGRNV